MRTHRDSLRTGTLVKTKQRAASAAPFAPWIHLPTRDSDSCPLELIFQRQLEEAGIRGVVLECLCVGYIACIRIEVIGGGIAERWMVQYVESIRAELEVLLMPRRKVLEERHIDAIVARSVALIGLPAKVLNHCGKIRNWCRDQVPGQRVGKGAGVVP